MQITKMQPAHIAQIAELERACFSAPWSERDLHAELENPLSLWLSALDGETVVGYIGSQSVCGEADMMNLAVLPAYRRQGIAAQLVRELCATLASSGVSSLTLEVRASNEAAKGLYTSLGFTVAGVRPGYYEKPREDALILKKEWETA